MTRVQQAHRRQGDVAADKGRRPGICRAGRGSVQPVSPRTRSRAIVADGRRAVVIGGFHVSGCLSMLRACRPDLVEAQALGVTLYAGEGGGADGRPPARHRRGPLKPVYNYLAPRPPSRRRPSRCSRRTWSGGSSAIIRASTSAAAVHSSAASAPSSTSRAASLASHPRRSRGHRARRRRPRRHRFFRHRRQFRPQPHWEAIVDRLIVLRETKGIPIKPPSSRSTRSATRFRASSRRAARAGCNQVFIGLESINPQSLQGARKRPERSGDIGSCCRRRKQPRDDLGGLSSSVFRPNAGIDRPRHRNYQAGIAGRHSRILLPDAAARLGGPQGSVNARGPDRPGLNEYDVEHSAHGHA